MTPLLVATAVAVFAGAALQAATGFGFALLAAPLAFAALEPHEAIGLLLLLGMEIGVLTLATEGRRPRPMVRRCALVLAWAVPAAVAGVAVLRALDPVALQVAVSVGVAATLIVRRRAPADAPRAGAALGRARHRPRARARWSPRRTRAARRCCSTCSAAATSPCACATR